MQSDCLRGALLLLCAGCAAAAVPVRGGDPSPPTWPTQYAVSGTLQLPYAEISEPFDAYYDGPGGRSRIDYYDGLTRTFLRGDVAPYGATYKLSYMSVYEGGVQATSNECFLAPGTQDAPVSAQPVLPDLDGFEFVGTAEIESLPCYVWQNVQKVGYKINTYTLWTLGVNASFGIPVRYEMMGYDSLFASHYDKYYVTYDVSTYRPTVDSSDVFNIPDNSTCHGFPGPGIHVMNPMSEFIGAASVDHHEKPFHDFRTERGRDYKQDSKEYAARKQTFVHNSRFIHSRNRAGLTYGLAINHLTDRTDDEIRVLRGRMKTKGYNGGLPFPEELKKISDMPTDYDWRILGAVTPVKDQAVCGSCWSFGTTGTIEGAYFRKTGQLMRLSQQELMDCSWGEGNNGCDGGEDFRAYQWIMKSGGLAAEEAYGPYLGEDGKCHSENVTSKVNILNYVNITKGDIDALNSAIYKIGPISVGIDASHKSLSFYANGVYYEPQCGNTDDDLDHAVLAVGFGELNGEPYWLIKNSWSTYWGNDGYVLMSQKNNNCGAATAATFVIM